MQRQWMVTAALAAGLVACGGESKPVDSEARAAATAQNRYLQGAPLGTKQIYDPATGLGVTKPEGQGVNSPGDTSGGGHGAPNSAQTGGGGTTR